MDSKGGPSVKIAATQDEEEFKVVAALAVDVKWDKVEARSAGALAAELELPQDNRPEMQTTPGNLPRDS